MSNRERIGIASISLFLIFSIFSSTKQFNFDEIYSKVNNVSNSLLAKVGDVLPQETPTTKSVSSTVQVIKPSDSLMVQLEKVEDNQVVPVERCETKEALARYPINRKELARDARCTSGYMEGTVLNIKIANASNSIATLDQLIQLLKGTLDNLNSKGTIDGMVLAGMPMGAEIKTAIENADNISVACIDKNGDKQKNQKVGKYKPVSDIMYTNITEEQKKSLAFIKNGIKDLNTKIQQSQESKEDIVQKLLLQSLEIVKKFKTDFLPIDASLLADNVNLDKFASLRMIVDMQKDNSNNLIVDNPNTILSYKISFATRFMSGIPHISEPYYKGKVTMSVDNESIENDTVVIPEPIIFKDLKETVISKIDQLAKIREKYVKNLSLAQDAKKKLEFNSYYCQI
jgi:hypothetical protein